MRVLIVGCGYVGMEVARACIAGGHEVHGVRRSPAGLAALASAGIQPLPGDVSNASSVATWPRRWDVVVNAVSSSGGGIEGYRRAYLDGSTNLASHLRHSPPCRVVHLGSTSVYPHVDGSWVDEDSPANPTGEAARVLVAAEQAWLDAWRRHALPVVLLRASGIYGPGRGRMLARVLSGEARIDGDGPRWLNMIHRDDVAGAVLAAMTRGVPGRIYNVTDNEPVQQRDFLVWLASSRGLPVPPRQDATPRPFHGASSSVRAPTDKRVSNHRLRDELGWQPRFPTFREGYAPGTTAVPGSTPAPGPG